MRWRENLKLDIEYEIEIDESELYIYDPTSDYYNDICNITTSESGTDITLNNTLKGKIDFDNNKIGFGDTQQIYTNEQSISPEYPAKPWNQLRRILLQGQHSHYETGAPAGKNRLL